MKILFAIQATGNGHISRAREILPHLKNHGEVDIAISGTQNDVWLADKIKYKYRGISYTFGKRGGVDILDTLIKLAPISFIRDVINCPVKDYDLVINDFEPVTAWACKLKGKTCLALSHQASFLSEKTPRPKSRDAFAEGLFRNFAPSSKAIGLHFETYDDFIKPPIIRSEIRGLNPSNKGHVTVYLPAYSEKKLCEIFKPINDFQWHVFSKHTKRKYELNNCLVLPIENDQYLQSIEGSEGLLTGAGFESPAEGLHLGKKVLVVPMAFQYEQLCNAEAFRKLGGNLLTKMDSSATDAINDWINRSKPLSVSYPDQTASIINELIALNLKPS